MKDGEPAPRAPADVDLVALLLKRMEAHDLDFKRNQYPLESDKDKSKFVKDIVALANTPRSGAAYILIGVDEEGGQVRSVVGCDDHPDPAKLSNLVSGHMDEYPRFSYRVVEYEGKMLGLIEIRPSPHIFMVRNSFGELTKGVIYTRRAAQNAQADPGEIQRMAKWVSTVPDVDEVAIQEVAVGSWEQLRRESDFFNDRRIYVAVIDSDEQMSAQDWDTLARVRWNLVIDFDRDTDEIGAYKHAGASLAKLRSVRFTALDDRVASIGPSAGVWVAALGVNSRPTTVQKAGWREWNRTRAGVLGRVVADFAAATAPAPATVVVFGGPPDHVDTVCALLDQHLGERLRFVVASASADAYSSLIVKWDAAYVGISLPQTCRGLRESRQAASVTEGLSLPRIDGGTETLEPERARWLEEDLELVHVAAGLKPTDDEELRNFLRGYPATWYGLNSRVDVDRSVTPKIEAAISDALASRGTRRLILRHWPGAGGSTVARRIAWDFHARFPTVLAHAVRSPETGQRIQFLFSLTKLPPLVVIDGQAAGRDELDRLYDELRSANVPALLLQVERYHGRANVGGSYYLEDVLTTPEAVALAERLAQQAPDRRPALQALVDGPAPVQRSPFYFGLVAFGEDFVAIEPYVAQRIASVSEPAITIARLSALVHHFGQRATPIQLLAPQLGVSRGTVVTPDQVLPDPLRDLFVEANSGEIRPAHELLSAEILQQLLSQGMSDRRNWRTHLVDAAVEFISLCSQQHSHPGDLASELVRAVLVERGTGETVRGPWEGQFAQLIVEIPTTEGKRRVVEALTECFPDEPHFWAHLGRFHSRMTRDYAAAEKALRQAAELDENDPLLFHMWGMAQRADVYQQLEGRARNRASC